MKLVARAPGKVNLCLLLGPARTDGRHEVATLLESVSLADELELVVRDVTGGADEVACPGVSEPNIVERALAGLRERGWDAPPVRVTIDKRIPVAAGMGGGSADAGAVLRMASLVSPVPVAALAELAASLGSDVPSGVEPGLSLGTGAGEIVERRAPLAPHAFVIVPQPHSLSTADVYREADRLGLPRAAEDFAAVSASLASGVGPGVRLEPELIVNDLAPAAVSLCPPISEALDAVRAAGAEHALVCGSGPTVFGLFWGEDADERAGAAVSALVRRYPRSNSAVPVEEEFGTVVRK